MPSDTTAISRARYGASRRIRRLADGQNLIDFSAGMPAPIHGGPPWRGPAPGMRAAVFFGAPLPGCTPGGLAPFPC
ncbi:hypothetical protein Vau01_071040 [Virgisporangium aurantiacum]|uniref:Uncharacterized protein n=1 Tax=Virgisporangium aurantiacum TaxID=175570 RepID=A0A8J3ZE43_9ACTN|nr:hypothetical protein Vau01_071040 [Virgisporangium aurantiacum]